MDEIVNEPPPPLPEEAQLRALLAALEAAHQGDFTRRLPVYGTQGLTDRLAMAFNALGDQVSTVVTEVSRVTREVGTEGKLGGHADVRGLSGIWRELTEGVNVLASSFTAQVRDCARVAAAVAQGDVSQKITADARGETLALKLTINTMVDQLAAFAAEVNRVAKEVGTEEKLGSQPSAWGMSGVWKDLSDNVTVTEQLALASRHKSEFLANMSHELRTPLNSLLILAKVLAENKERRLSAKEVEYAKTIHASGADLLSLVNEILDLSKVEAGKMTVDPRDVPLSEVKAFVERNFRHVAEQKGLGFAVKLAPDLPPGLRTDPQRLLQVLKNLLSNALKFTDRGAVELRITSVDSQRMRFENEALPRAGRVLAFSVVDTGIGIPQDKQQLIFEAFQQAEGSTSGKYGGTGLGLSISRAMSRLLGGELQVSSQPGQGSTFTLYLPERYAPPDSLPSPRNGEATERVGSPPEPDFGLARRQPSPSALARSDTRLAGRKVLLVDDDIRNSFALTSVLEGRRMEVLHAENGKAGLAVLRAHPGVDAILMDMTMPELDGYETMRAIRQEPRFATLPIIAVTARALPDDRERCLAAGASDYLPKPVDPDRLLELLRHWLREPLSPAQP